MLLNATPGTIVETKDTRQIILEKNEKDTATMEALSAAISKINALGIRNGSDQRILFALE